MCSPRAEVHTLHIPHTAHAAEQHAWARSAAAGAAKGKGRLHLCRRQLLRGLPWSVGLLLPAASIDPPAGLGGAVQLLLHELVMRVLAAGGARRRVLRRVYTGCTPCRAVHSCFLWLRVDSLRRGLSRPVAQVCQHRCCCGRADARCGVAQQHVVHACCRPRCRGAVPEALPGQGQRRRRRQQRSHCRRRQRRGVLQNGSLSASGRHVVRWCVPMTCVCNYRTLTNSMELRTAA